MKGDEARAEASLLPALEVARLWHRQGRSGDAGELLAAIRGWFTEEFDTLDLKASSVLLAQFS